MHNFFEFVTRRNIRILKANEEIYRQTSIFGGMKVNIFVTFLALSFLFSCGSEPKIKGMVRMPEPTHQQYADRYQVGILIMDGVYNTELTAPYDIFQHTQFREGIKQMDVFMVAEKMEVVRTFEGMRIMPDYSFGSSPKIDILVVPSAEHHLDSDLENEKMLEWVKETGDKAEYVTSHCDGAFVLAKAGLLDDVASTTFPSDIPKYKEMFPKLDVRDSVLFVHDGKFITSAGGAKSFEAALYLCEKLYGEEVTKRLAKGLVINWQLSEVPRVVIE